MRILSSRPGIALVSALALLALLGLLLAGAVASATIAQHALHASLADAPLLGAADYAAGAVLGNPQSFGLADLPLQRPQTFDIPVPCVKPALIASVTATGTSSGLYWLVAKSVSSESDTARRRIGVIARTIWVGPPPSAPFVARGSTSLSPDVVVLADTTGGPDCAVSSAPAPIQTTDSASLFDGGGRWAALAAASGVRTTAGDTTLTAGTFDGILMVSGNLVIDGPFTMTGLIVARAGPSAPNIGFDPHRGSGIPVRFCVVDRSARCHSALCALSGRPAFATRVAPARGAGLGVGRAVLSFVTAVTSATACYLVQSRSFSGGRDELVCPMEGSTSSKTKAVERKRRDQLSAERDSPSRLSGRLVSQ